MLVALGTVGSVAISLWFAVFSRREIAKIYISSTLTAGSNERHVNITITNKGSVDYRLSHMYFHLNDKIIMPMPQQFLMPLPDDKTPNPPGFRVNCYLHMIAFDAFIDNNQSVTPDESKQILKKGYISVYTSRGTIFKVKFPEDFIQHYHEYRLSKQQTNK